jgi:hypothetical protein
LPAYGSIKREPGPSKVPYADCRRAREIEQGQLNESISQAFFYYDENVRNVYANHLYANRYDNAKHSCYFYC